MVIAVQYLYILFSLFCMGLSPRFSCFTVRSVKKSKCRHLAETELKFAFLGCSATKPFCGQNVDKLREAPVQDIANPARQLIEIEAGQLPAGLYALQIATPKGNLVRKFSVQ